MKAAQRVLVNTLAQYSRVLINMLLSLYTVRLVLETLGASDYGIYTLIAGVVAMLAFITNSLVSTTQRYVSYYQGKGDMEKLKIVFNNSLFIHIFISIIVVLTLELLSSFLFDGFLNIPTERICAAKSVYQSVVAIILVTFSTAPFRALLVSHENIVYISIIDVLDGILKLILIVVLTFLPYDKLIGYGLMMLGIQIFNFCALAGYCYIKYDECVIPRISNIDIKSVKEMGKYAGWNLYSTGCTVGRQQGIAIVLNKVAGPIINAAYGIGFQVAGYTNFLSASLVNAIAPQIIKAEGHGDRQKALWLSNVTSKFLFFLLSAVCIPCMFEIDSVLEWWLKDVPENAAFFCVMVMVTLLCDSLSIGLMYINQAIGKIGLYTIIVSTPKLLTLPLAWICLKNNYSILSVAIIYVGIELLCAIIRIPFIKYTAGLDVSNFFREVTLREFFPVIICVAVSYLSSHLFSFQYSFFLTFFISIVLYGLAIFIIGLTKKEKVILLDLSRGILRRLNIKA